MLWGIYRVYQKEVPWSYVMGIYRVYQKEVPWSYVMGIYRVYQMEVPWSFVHNTVTSCSDVICQFYKHTHTHVT